MADGRSLNAVGIGDLHIELPNGLDKTKTIFKNAIHAIIDCFLGGVLTIIQTEHRVLRK